ncbi:hypothetical protein O9992_28530 [Vibrio lentus]|nr:hypothetical protein [Vibrio lentus]
MAPKSLATTYDLTLQMGLIVAPSVLLDYCIQSVPTGCRWFRTNDPSVHVVMKPRKRRVLLNELGNRVTVAKSISDMLLLRLSRQSTITAGKALFEDTHRS